MNFDKELFKTTEAREFGEFENLELGGHEVKILKAEEYTSPVSCTTSLKVEVDVSGNDKQAGFFQKQYDENPNADKRWPTGATRYLSLKPESIAYLKGFITSLEKSNPNFKFNPDGIWDQIKNLKIAGVFGLEEYQGSDGDVHKATKLTQFRSLDKLSEITIPSVKLVDGTYIDYESYKNRSNSTTSASSAEIKANDIPFEL